MTDAYLNNHGQVDMRMQTPALVSWYVMTWVITYHGQNAGDEVRGGVHVVTGAFFLHTHRLGRCPFCAHPQDDDDHDHDHEEDDDGRHGRCAGTHAHTQPPNEKQG